MYFYICVEYKQWIVFLESHDKSFQELGFILLEILSDARNCFFQGTASLS